MTYDQGNDNGWDAGPGLLESVLRYWRVVLVVTIVFGLVGYGGSFLQEKLYEGEARVVLTDPRNSEQFNQIVIDPSRHVRNQAEVMTSSLVLARATQLQGSGLSVKVLEERVTASASTNIDLITVSALDPSPEGAASLANAVVEAYEQIVIEGVQSNADKSIAAIEESAASLRQRIGALEDQLKATPGDSALTAQRDALVVELANYTSRADQIQVDAALYGSGVDVFEPANIPESPAQPQPLRNAALALVLGAMAASAWAWWRADRRDESEHRHDPAPVLGAPLLAEVPDFADTKVTGQLPAATHPKSHVAEAYNFLSSGIDFALAAEDSRVVLVSSMSPGDGKSITAANLAVASSQPGRTVLLVDGDERARGLSRLLKMDERIGLTDMGASPNGAVSSYVNSIKELKADLGFVPAGSPAGDTAAFFRSAGFRSAMRRLRDSADLVILDSPPILAVADTTAMASQVDGIVLVVDHGSSLRGLAEVRDQLAFLGVPLLGYVYNRAPANGGRGYGRYGYGRYGYGRYGYGYGGSAYGYGAEEIPEPKRRRRRSESV